MNCYFPGCAEKGITKEHIPPRSFFPEGERVQLLTIKSCKKHNNEKSKDDLYALAQICINASPNNRAQEVFKSTVLPQLNFNNGALGEKLFQNAVWLSSGSFKVPVDVARLDSFFTALSYGIIFKSSGASLPKGYEIRHIFHNFSSESTSQKTLIDAEISRFYSGKPMDFMEFGSLDLQNQRIYTATIFGVPNFQSSITIVHKFFGCFKVTSMLTRVAAGFPSLIAVRRE